MPQNIAGRVMERDNISRKRQREDEPKTPKKVAQTSETRHDCTTVIETPSKLLETKIWNLKVEMEEKMNYLKELEATLANYKQGKAQIARAIELLN